VEATLYLDWNATTPPAPEVLVAMRDAAEQAWANPASVHGAGRRARAHVEAAREAVAGLCQVDARDVTLTSGGTEANNLAILHAFSDVPTGQAMVLSRLEHPSVVRTAEQLAARGATVVWVEPRPSGEVSADSYARAMDEAAVGARLRLVSLQAVNHETGVIQPVAEVLEQSRARGVPLHVDAVQAAGRLPPETWVGADLVTIAAHKLRGPKGIGAVATRPRLRLRGLLRGGEQERGVRPGTQDPVAAAGFAAAVARAEGMPARYREIASLRDELERELARIGAAAGGEPLRNGTARRAPHVSNLSWPGWGGPELCAALDLEGVAVSSGSACSAGTADPSPVLEAMLGRERAATAVRVSLGETTTPQVILEVIHKWSRVLGRTSRNV